MGKSSKTTQTQQVDPKTQQYVDAMRRMAQQSAGGIMGREGSFFTGPQDMAVGDQINAFMSPYISNVVDATRGEFDFLRGQALNSTNQQATQAGAFGGSRQAVLAGSRLGELDRGQGSTIAGLLNQGYQNAAGMAIPYFENQRQLRQQQLQEPIFRAQQAQGLLGGAIGPYGMTASQTQQNPWYKDVAGLLLAGSSFLPGGGGK